MFSDFFRDDSAQGLVEYALLLSLLALTALASLRLLGRKSSMTFSSTARFLK